MTTKLAAAVAAAALAVGILVGASGTVLVHDATRPALDIGDMAQMHQMMGGLGRSMMGRSMMDGSMMDGSMMDGSSGSMGLADHQSHHGSDQ